MSRPAPVGSTARLSEAADPTNNPTDHSPASSPPASSPFLVCLVNHDIPQNALSHSVALIRPCIWLWAALVGVVSLMRAAFYHYSGTTLHRNGSADEPRTRPRPSPASSRRSSNEKLPTSPLSAGEAGTDGAAVSSGFSTLGRYISISARRFHSTLRPPPVLKIGGLYHELDQVAETDEDAVQSAPPASPVAQYEPQARPGRMTNPSPGRADRVSPGGSAGAADPAPARSTPARQSSSEYEVEGELTEDGGSSDSASEACTVEDYRGLPPAAASPTAGRKGFASWLTKPLRRRGSSDPARSDTSLSATSADTSASLPSTGTSSTSKSHCPTQRLAERRQAKKNRSVTTPLPDRPKLRTAASTPIAPSPRSHSPARAPSPIPSLCLSRPRSTPFLRTSSLDGLTSYPSPTCSRDAGPAPPRDADWPPPHAHAPKRSNTLGSKLRARSPFSPKIRSPLATPPASPTLSPVMPAFAFLRRKSWDSDKVDKKEEEAGGTSLGDNSASDESFVRA